MSSNPESQKEELELQTESDGPGEGKASSERTRSRRRSRSIGSESSVNMDELRELIQLIRENEFTEFELEREGFRVRFRRGAEAAEPGSSGVNAAGESAVSATSTSPAVSTTVSSSAAPAHPGAKAQTEASEDQDLHIIPSPIVGTFYRAASPTADSFIKIGSTVEHDTVVCIIEAMKLMNEITAETSGEVVKIYVENGQPVEYGQPLFGIKK
ncbi:MAG TPA: acetyl-CoA carboxylase biotin carboxyl carrier protein [Pyrinomonadaceae bacterium]|jgi:acetyl-CoA carboxylase biotin carboxyl carrier protein|nr:acetyl-CoA carboxylase biotin carboxyl carrier protein [Pyrinomonadaceae bacterium]